jgi:hypothetical protein
MDQAALTIALVSIAISIVGLLWQLTLYRLSGARIRIGFTPVVMTHRGTIVKGSRGQWPKQLPGIAELQESDLWVELAQIDIANVGRTAIWASGIGLDFGPESLLRRRQRLTLSLRPFGVGGGLIDNSPTRLEPGQAVVMYVTLRESITWAGGHHRHERIAVRGTATLAGRRAKRSPWRRALRVNEGHSKRFPHGETTLPVLIFQELVNHWPTSDIGHLYETWLAVWGALDDPSEGETIENALKPHFKSMMARISFAHRLRAVFASSTSLV